MNMDSRVAGFSGSLNGFNFEDEMAFKDSNQYPNSANGFKFMDHASDLNFNYVDGPLVLSDLDPTSSAVSSAMSMDEDSPDDNDFSETVLKYIGQMLMEEDMEEKPCMFHDPLALQAAERSLYDVLSEDHPPSPDQFLSYGDQFLVDSPDNEFLSSPSDNSTNSSSGCNASSSVDLQWHGEFGEIKPSFLQTPLPTDFVFQSTPKSSSHSSITLQNGSENNGYNDVMQSSGIKIMVPNIFSGESELALQFKKGMEEANKFLPKGNPFLLDLETSTFSSEVVVKMEKEEGKELPNWLSGKKNHMREDEDFEEERNNKQSALYVDDGELAELFDKMVICDRKRGQPPTCILDEDPQSESGNTQPRNGKTNGLNGGKARDKQQGNKKEVDLRTLLILCAQAVSSDDRRTANDLLKQIRQHASPFGDGSQRAAHWFANGLEARLSGTGTQIYTALSDENTSAADMLKAYLAYISLCPFTKMAVIFANHNILSLSKKAKTIHIIDFGILYGFQWPALIFRLAKRPEGPPKLRITGIELPQSGFRPAERVQETGRRLAKYCERHNVPFEYNGIAQKWETIRVDDLKIKSGEFLAVNCLFRFKNLLDETVVVGSPRNAVLRLIRKANPDIFVHAIVNGSYNAPFFVTRFREALFHFSALFDICDTSMSCEDHMRLKFEKEFFGRELMNVIACEGSERVERPETYKQWQVRNMRVGLKQVPLDPLVIRKLTNKVKEAYHSDFTINEDGHWILQGWKGRIVYASSMWIPA